jgi:GntR family transcriptional regulator/MocR family aminotransferase
VARRLALLAWAEENDSLIIEDDYDSEFRFDAPPIPALASLDTTGRVAYIGTFSKVLAPTLRVGYLVAPPFLRERLAAYKRLLDYHTAEPVQRALTYFLVEGHLDRHIRRLRRHYAQKRALLHESLSELAPRAILQGIEAGLHVFLEIASPLDLSHFCERLFREQLISVQTLANYYYGEERRQGLLLGYGGLTIEQVREGSQKLAKALSQSII